MRFGGASPGGRGFRSSTQGEDLTRPILESGVLRQLVALLKPYKYQVAGLSVLISASAALGTVAPQFVRIAFDEVIPRGEIRPFLYLALAFVVFYLLRALVQYAGMYLSYAFTQEIISDIRIRAYERLLHLPIVRFTEERSGSLTSRVVNDVNALEGMIQAGATRLAGQLFSILVISAILIWMDWRLAAINLVAVPLLAGITRHYQIPLRQASRAIRKRVGEMTAIASESISNIQVVKSFASERIERDRFGGENDEYVTLNLDRRKDVGKMEAYITLTAEYAVGTLLLVGGWLVVGGDITLGELTAFVMYQRQLQSPVMSVMFFNNQLQAGMAALERVSDLLDSEPEKGGPVDEMVSGQVEMRDVHFTFPGAERPALGGVSFRIPAGTTAALVGPSGAGKTTVTKLLGRLYDADAGSVLVGGLDVEEYDLETLRSGIALVPQEPTLFSGSVRENIRYADPEASDEAIVRAARLANAEEFITLLPQGYETEIGERGVKLSGGQKQRIAIARAILKEAKILVLDEATSALDSESEAVIQDALEGLFADRSGVTSIVIAHRLSTIDGADNILVLDDGKLVEQGTHGELMVQGGLYASLRERQYRDQATEEFLELQPSLE